MNSHPETAAARQAYGRQAIDYHYEFDSWGAVMQHHSEKFSTKPWLTYIDAGGAKSGYTYSAFIEQARKLATLLSERGVERGSRVALAGHNHPDTILIYFACWLKGACAVPLNMTEDDNRIGFILNNSGASVLLGRFEYIERIRGVMATGTTTICLVELDSELETSTFYSDVEACEPHAYPMLELDMRWDECLLVYTSGTTGNPKGVVLIQQNLFADGFEIARWHGIDSEQTMMCVLPVHHVNGTIVTHVTPFLVGASVVLHRKFSVSRFWDSIVSERVNVVSVVPTLLAFLLEAKAEFNRSESNTFRHVICGAGPLTCDLARRFEDAYHVPIVHGYGLSETTCYTCFLPTELTLDEHRHWMQDHGYPSIGTCLPCNEMDVQTPTGQGVSEGERGELVSRGPNVMKEYYRNPEANASAFANGWFRSGDEGFFKTDKQGRRFYFITGRLKELIIRGGVNLAPLEIDEVISMAPGVRAGICVGFPHDMYGEEIGALVVPEGNNVKKEDILKYCRAHLPFPKQPKIVLFADELPVTSTGKYQRNSVKHLFDAFQGVQFIDPKS